jgi:hypothetical protein
MSDGPVRIAVFFPDYFCRTESGPAETVRKTVVQNYRQNLRKIIFFVNDYSIP